MRPMLSAVLIVLLGLAGAGRPQEKAKGDPSKQELPLKDKVTWDVKVFENDKDSFTVVKRTIDEGKTQVTWLLETNSEAAARRMNIHTESANSGYYALFQDGDGVVINKAKLVTDPPKDVRKGDRVRATFKIAEQEVPEKTEKIAIKYIVD